MLITLDTNKLTIGQITKLIGMVTNEEDYEALKHEIGIDQEDQELPSYYHHTEPFNVKGLSPAWCSECNAQAQPSCKHH